MDISILRQGALPGSARTFLAEVLLWIVALAFVHATVMIYA
jgi:hypothetical protein